MTEQRNDVVALAPPAYILLSPLSITESKTNPRKHFDPEKLQQLAASIREHGILEPLLVRPVMDGESINDYELVAGARRYRAAKLAQFKPLPCIVRTLTDLEALEIQVTENLQRDDLHPLEEAEGYRLLMQRHGHKVEAVAARLGRSVKYVYDRVKLLALTKEAQELFLAGKITAGHAVILARLRPADQARVVGKHDEDDGDYVGGGLFVHDQVLVKPYNANDDGDEGDETDDFKVVSVRELQSWIDENVRFERVGVDPMLFPETANRVDEAQDRKLKIIPITRTHHVVPQAKAEGERTYGPQSWKRADGLEKSKACEYAVLGVVVVGYGRGETFDVCTAKEKCKTHWSKEIAARAKPTKGGQAMSSRAKEEDRWKREEEKRKQEQAANEAFQARWRKAKPTILKALAAAVSKAPTAAGGYLAGVIIQACVRYNHQSITGLVPRGKTAEDLIRHAAFLNLGGLAADDWAATRGEVKPIFKALNLDLEKILAAAAPEAKKPAPAKPVKAGKARSAKSKTRKAS